jgi:hypothetical protein
MARKRLPEDAVRLRDFAKAARDAAEKLGIKKQVVADFPLDRSLRLLVSRATSLPPTLKKKLRAKRADFTIADMARMLLAVAESMPAVFSIQAVNLLLVGKILTESLKQTLAPSVPAEGRKRRKGKAASGNVYQLKITLLGIKPPIWRRIQVEDCTLDLLHEHIQTAMGWSNSHLHHFKFGEQFVGNPDLMQENFDEYGYEDSTTTKLSDVVPPRAKKSRFVYEYDFGDSWEHEVLVEKILPADPRTGYPVCIDGKRACPPDDVGGIWSYPDFLKAIRNKSHERHEEMLEWIGGSFDPEEFDLAVTTQAMRRGLPRWR